MQFNNFLRCFLLIAIGITAFLSPSRGANEPNKGRIALVIGNNKYEPLVGALKNPVNDAKAMAKALKMLGFTVIEKHNVTRDELIAAELQFRQKIPGAQVALFYYAGHGLSVSGSNYLVPLKSGYNPEGHNETDLRLLAETKLFNAEQAVAEMHAAGAICNLVILDACRTTPIARNPNIRAAGPAGGLVEMNPPAGSLVAFATDAGQSANDGDGANGLYTEELIKHLLTPGLTIEQVFKKTRAGVLQRSGGTQIPAEYSRLVGDDILLAGPLSSPQRAPTAPPAAETASVTPSATPAAAAPAPASPKAEPVPLPTLAEINKFAAAGDALHCVEGLRRISHMRGAASSSAAHPLEALLNCVKDLLRDETTAAAKAQTALDDCDLILPALIDCLPSDYPERAALTSAAHSRRGDALLLLGRADDALAAFNQAAALTPSNPYVLYNRGRAYQALNRMDEAKADYAAAADPKFKHSAARKLAQTALDALK